MRLCSSRLFRRGVRLAAVVGVLLAGAMRASAAAEKAPASYDDEIKPLLDDYCFRCHGTVKPKHGVNLERFQDLTSIHREPKLWRSVLTQLNERTMPPEDKAQPSEEERALLIEWIQHTLNNPDPSAFAKDPGRVTIRRLNRFEYNNTVRDLFDVAARPAESFPADGAGGAGFDNNADTLFIPPILMEQYLAAADAVLKEARDDRLLVARPSESLPKAEAAEKVLYHWTFQAFRRPVNHEVVEKYLRLFHLADRRGDAFPDAIRLALKGVLVSPHFLFRVEKDNPEAGTEPWEVDDFELASRLSYFLWSTMPDDALFELAKAGRLRDPATLEAQVRRMLKDPKSKALAESFGTQWLGVRDLLTTANPDPQKFPQFNAQLRFSMYDEAVAFVDSVFRDDAPLTTLIDANYTYVNDWLADHYGIKNRIGGGDGRGEVLRRVELKDGNRGGVLGLGAVLTVTSYPLRTSPVLRGKWVLEEILGAPPPPPPPDVPELPKDDSKHGGLSFRQQLELHRKQAQCASCHNRMDPLGFGLENYDAVGRWRTELAGEPVDASGVMTTGETFAGPAELKKVLLSRKGEFVRNVTEKMLAYALGRGLEYYDQPTVKEITDRLAANEHKSATLVLEVVRSYPFRYRRNATPATVAAPAQAQGPGAAPAESGGKKDQSTGGANPAGESDEELTTDE